MGSSGAGAVWCPDRPDRAGRPAPTHDSKQRFGAVASTGVPIRSVAPGDRVPVRVGGPQSVTSSTRPHARAVSTSIGSVPSASRRVR